MRVIHGTLKDETVTVPGGATVTHTYTIPGAAGCKFGIIWLASGPAGGGSWNSGGGAVIYVTDVEMDTAISVVKNFPGGTTYDRNNQPEFRLRENGAFALNGTFLLGNNWLQLRSIYLDSVVGGLVVTVFNSAASTPDTLRINCRYILFG